MNQVRPTYSVVIRSGLPYEETKLLEQFCGKILGENGEFLLHFSCSSINTEHHYYIEMEAYCQDSGAEYCIRIPHSLVFFIEGSEERKSIGFSQLK